MFEKILTRAFFTTLFAALAVTSAHALDAMQAVSQTQAAAAAAAKTLVAATPAERTQN